MSGVAWEQEAWAKISFYPNGTADELRMIVFDGKERFGLEVELTTGLVSYEPDPMNAWKARR
jgi:hypothetical protein